MKSSRKGPPDPLPPSKRAGAKLAKEFGGMILKLVSLSICSFSSQVTVTVEKLPMIGANGV